MLLKHLQVDFAFLASTGIESSQTLTPASEGIHDKASTSLPLSSTYSEFDKLLKLSLVDTGGCLRSCHLVIWFRNHEYSVLSRKDLWSYYQSMGLEFRYPLGKVLGTQDRPTLRLASHHYVLCLNLIKSIFNICIYTHTHTHYHTSKHTIWHLYPKTTYLSIYPNKRELNISKKP